MKSLESLESEVSSSLADRWQSLDNFSDSVDSSLEFDNGGTEFALGVLLFLADLVVALVGLEESDNSLGALLCLILSALETDGVIVSASGGGVVQVSQVHGIVRELVTVEFNQVRVPSLSELPNDAAGDLHYVYITPIFIRKKLTSE